MTDLGKYWHCTDHDPHYDGNLGRRLRARVTELNKPNEETMEDYWVLEDEDDTYFASWKQIYQANQQQLYNNNFIDSLVDTNTREKTIS